jgi:hypothetical protein
VLAERRFAVAALPFVRDAVPLRRPERGQDRGDLAVTMQRGEVLAEVADRLAGMSLNLSDDLAFFLGGGAEVS